jgi:hypothetical protein
MRTNLKSVQVLKVKFDHKLYISLQSSFEVVDNFFDLLILKFLFAGFCVN